MKRETWTDERLSERFDSVDKRFDAVDKRFDGVDRSLERLDGDIRDLRHTMCQLWGTNMAAILVTLVAVIVTRT